MSDCPKSCAMFPLVTIRFQNDSRLYQLQLNLVVNFEFYSQTCIILSGHPLGMAK